MGLIYVPKPWTEQPQEAVDLNASFPRPRRLVLLSVGLRDLAEGVTLSTEPAPVGVRADVGGLGWYGDPGADCAFTVPMWTDTTGEASAVIYQRRWTTDSNDWLELGASGTGDHWPFSGGAMTDAFWGSRWCNGVSLANIAITRPHTVVMAVKSGSQRIHVNGSLFHSNTLTGAFAVPATGYLGGTGTRGNRAYTYLVALYDRFVTDADAAAISANPWQLFAPRRVPIFYSTAAGGLPTLSNARVTGVTTTTATPLVDYAY